MTVGIFLLIIYVHNFKEKFGSLRFYHTIIPVEGKEHNERQYGNIDGIISFAEFLSFNICEDCGSTEKVTQTEGMVYTLCKKCLKKEKK